MGDIKEKWRHKPKEPPQWIPQVPMRKLDPLKDLASVKSFSPLTHASENLFEENGEFEFAPEPLVSENPWKTCFGMRPRRPEHIGILEARGF